MSTLKIEGSIHYQSLGTGFWGIIDGEGNKWRPSNLPEKLQKEGTKISLTAKQSKEQFSIFMWGTAIDIIEIQ